MERRDYLQDQVEQLGRVLQHMLARLLGHKTNTSIGSETLDEILREHTGTDLEEILQMDKPRLESLMHTALFQRSTDAETLAEILIVFSETTSSKEKAGNAAQAAKYILDIIDQKEATVSLHRMALRERAGL